MGGWVGWVHVSILPTYTYLDGSADHVVPANHRVELAVQGLLGEVAAVLFEVFALGHGVGAHPGVAPTPSSPTGGHGEGTRGKVEEEVGQGRGEGCGGMATQGRGQEGGRLPQQGALGKGVGAAAAAAEQVAEHGLSCGVGGFLGWDTFCDAGWGGGSVAMGTGDRRRGGGGGGGGRRSRRACYSPRMLV